MTIRKKTFIILFISIAGMIGSLFIVSHMIFLKIFNDLQNNNTRKNVRRAISTLHKEIFYLDAVSRVLFVDEHMEMLYEKAFDTGSEKVVPLSKGVKKVIQNGNLAFILDSVPQQNAGLFILPERPALIAYCPIRDSREQTFLGTIMVGRYLE
jgi:sensor domain CHASE-containing protein